MSEIVMVFAVHPDDETLGAGGTLLKHIDNGDCVHWVIMTKMDEKLGHTKERMAEREEEILNVKKAYGIKEIHTLPFITTELDQYSMSEIVGEISTLVKKIGPEIIYIPFKNDIHTDHQVAFSALISLTKQFRYPTIKEVLCMEVLSETNFGHIDSRTSFGANVYVDITDYYIKKMEILKYYDSEILDHPFARSYKAVEAMSILRGAEANVKHAEAFQLVKMIR